MAGEVYIFEAPILIGKEDIEKIRKQLIEQISEGVVLLPGVEFAERIIRIDGIDYDVIVKAVLSEKECSENQPNQ